LVVYREFDRSIDLPKKITELDSCHQRGVICDCQCFAPTKRSSRNLREVTGEHAAPQSHFMTDESPAFTGIGWNFATATMTTWDVPANRPSPQTRSRALFPILKRGVDGIYPHICEAHLHRDLAEFDFRYSNREKLGVDDNARAMRAQRSRPIRQ
jgi:hypothetical protein